MFRNGLSETLLATGLVLAVCSSSGHSGTSEKAPIGPKYTALDGRVATSVDWDGAVFRITNTRSGGDITYTQIGSVPLNSALQSMRTAELAQYTDEQPRNGAVVFGNGDPAEDCEGEVYWDHGNKSIVEIDPALCIRVAQSLNVLNLALGATTPH